MIIENSRLTGVCTCGKQHSVATKFARIEKGCLQLLDRYMAEAGLTGHRTVIYDTNTYAANGLIRPRADQEIILQAEGLCADDGAVATVMHRMPAQTQVLIAVGGGTVHDIVRYCAYKRGLPFVSCPTAASVDGYSSNFCSMIWRGVKMRLPGVAPVFVLADLEVISRAPAHLARAGVGEGISKYISLADWKIEAELTGRELCPVGESLLRQAAIAAQGACIGLKEGKEGAYAQLMYGLLLAGMSTQIFESARPVSGAEHLLAHLMEMMPAYAPLKAVPHGELSGVCAGVIAGLYHRVALMVDVEPYVKAAEPLDRQWLVRHFGPETGEMLLSENTPDCLLSIPGDRLSECWETIRRIIEEIPDWSAMQDMLASVGARQTMGDLGISSDRLPRMLRLSACVSNQVTLVRILRMLQLRFAGSDFMPYRASPGTHRADMASRHAPAAEEISGRQ